MKNDPEYTRGGRPWLGLVLPLTMAFWILLAVGLWYLLT